MLIKILLTVLLLGAILMIVKRTSGCCGMKKGDNKDGQGDSGHEGGQGCCGHKH